MMRLNNGRAPMTALSLGLGDRFRYWRGASGDRYLFSLVGDRDFSGLQNVVVIEVALIGSETVPVWLGAIDSSGEKSGVDLGHSIANGHLTFVHCLADNDSDRLAIMNDLVGECA